MRKQMKKQSSSLITPAMRETIDRALNVALDRHDNKKSFTVFNQTVEDFKCAVRAYEGYQVDAQAVYMAGVDVIVMAIRIISEGCGEFPRYKGYRDVAKGGER